ncbi:MAG TPA: hypothetical protein VFF13_00175 [archaeon]|nr:hypothetical protein [archaeon]
MKYKMTDEKWNSITSFLNKVLKNPNKYPDKGLILSLSDEEMTQVFTKKRLELIRLIQSKKPNNATKLSELAGRRLSAVMRDLELLEEFTIVQLEKKGKNIKPRVTTEILVLPLIKLKTKNLREIKARA